MKRIIQQLQEQFPFMKKAGNLHKACSDPLRIISENNQPRTLVLLCGVEGCGKTTFAKKYLKEHTVINLDDLLKGYLNSHPGQPFTMASNLELNKIFLENATTALQKGMTVLDCANHNINFRSQTLSILKPYYDKVIMFVFNPPLTTINKQIKGQFLLRARPGLWQDVSNQYQLFQKQLKSGMLTLGVDDVYMLNLN